MRKFKWFVLYPAGIVTLALTSHRPVGWVIYQIVLITVGLILFDVFWRRRRT